MKKQMESTNKYTQMKNAEVREEFRKYHCKNTRLNSLLSKSRYILLLNDFQSSTISKKQLKKIFKQSHISIIFFNEFIDDKEILIKLNLEEENFILKEKLALADSKINQLEETVTLLQILISNLDKQKRSKY